MKENSSVATDLNEGTDLARAAISQTLSSPLIIMLGLGVVNYISVSKFIFYTVANFLEFLYQELIWIAGITSCPWLCDTSDFMEALAFYVLAGCWAFVAVLITLLVFIFLLRLLSPQYRSRHSLFNKRVLIRTPVVGIGILLCIFAVIPFGMLMEDLAEPIELLHRIQLVESPFAAIFLLLIGLFNGVLVTQLADPDVPILNAIRLTIRSITGNVITLCSALSILCIVSLVIALLIYIPYFIGRHLAYAEQFVGNFSWLNNVTQVFAEREFNLAYTVPLLFGIAAGCVLVNKPGREASDLS